MNRLTGVTAFIALAGATALSAACDSSQPQGGVFAEDPNTTPGPVATLPDGAPVPVGGDAGASYPIWDDAKGLDWLNAKCANCHGIDEGGQKALYYSAWPMPRPLTLEWLEVSDYSAAAYQTILNRISNTPGPPSPMPTEPPKNEAEALDLKAAADWFTRRVPFAVIDANRRYGNTSAVEQQIVANFSCAKRVTLRQFLTTLTLGIFDRYPTAREFGYFTDAELSSPVTEQQRNYFMPWVDNTDDSKAPAWKGEFLDVGLKKFATAIGGAPLIKATTGVTQAQADDLKLEFYQQLRAHYDDWNYADFFKANSVMVSPNTASLYGCSPPAAGTWQACDMLSPRQTFFTSRGFLVSKPTSFLVQNNNYGRTALIFFTLYGEKLFAATNGPTGDAIPKLPDCLEPTDTRTFTGAPRGTAAVPMSGAVCQGCHVARGLAAGSVLFRPFAMNGEVYTLGNIATDQNPDKKWWDQFFDQPDPGNPGKTIETLWGYLPPGLPNTAAPVKVTQQYMTDLLTATMSAPKSCVATGNKTNPYATVKNLSQLVDEYLKNTTSFARGFTRHAQRAFFNQTQVTLEMSVRATTSFESGKQKVPDLLKAYLMSDSLTCGE